MLEIYTFFNYLIFIIIEENKCNVFKKTYKNNLLILNIFFIFFHFFFFSTFLYFSFLLHFSSNSLITMVLKTGLDRPITVLVRSEALDRKVIEPESNHLNRWFDWWTRWTDQFPSNSPIQSFFIFLFFFPIAHFSSPRG